MSRITNSKFKGVVSFLDLQTSPSATEYHRVIWNMEWRITQPYPALIPDPQNHMVSTKWLSLKLLSLGVVPYIAVSDQNNYLINSKVLDTGFSLFYFHFNCSFPTGIKITISLVPELDWVQAPSCCFVPSLTCFSDSQAMCLCTTLFGSLGKSQRHINANKFPLWLDFNPHNLCWSLLCLWPVAGLWST